MTDRLREAADIVEEGFVYWTQDPVVYVGGHFRAVECEVAALLRAVADMAPRHPGPECLYGAGRCKEGLAIDAALRLADLILDDHG